MKKGKEKFLIVGGGGRESAFALKLNEEDSVCLYAVMDHKNPTIADCTEESGGEYLIEDTTDACAIAEFASKHKIDYAFVNADAPLAQGVVDELLKHKIKAVGGTKAATRIEWDKVYAMQLMEQNCPKFTPFYRIVSSEHELKSAISEFQKQKLLVVVKPQGLTGGKGVKVMREHLRTYSDSADYASLLLKQCESAKVLLVEKLDGIEFTVMGFTDGKNLVMSPASYDYPYRLENDKGLGTGGMGCFTDSKKLLPFMQYKDFRSCQQIMRKIIDAMKHDGLDFRGILNGGFFKTSKGIRFMEFNARFGDPEALNILTVLKTPFSKVIKDLWHQKLCSDQIKFSRRASVVKYLVAEEYPNQSTRITRFAVDEEAIINMGIKIYYASCVRKGNIYKTLKKSRVFALGKAAKNIVEASEAINHAIDRYVKGGLEYRKDIGSSDNLQKLSRISSEIEIVQPT